jgi:phosphoribosylglycinamide formyltransferase-1
VLVSGTGSNLQAIIAAIHSGQLLLDLVAVVSDRANAPALGHAHRNGVPTFVLEPRAFPNRTAWESALCELLDDCHPDLIALAGFMRILGPDTVGRFARRLLNIHPSLLPRYPGLHPHRRALEQGDPEHGATVHLVTPEVDAGPRLARIRVPVRPSDTEEALIERTKRAEHRLYPAVLTELARGHLVVTPDAVFWNGVRLESPLEFPFS